jgi:uncharacterized protein
MDDGLGRLVGFGRLLRARGLPVGTGRILAYCRAAAALAPLDRGRLYWAGRVTLVASREHIRDYDRAFNEYFGRLDLDETLKKLFEFAGKARVPSDPSVEAELDAARRELAGGEDEDVEELDVLPLVASGAEVLRTKSFDELSNEERLRAARIIRRIAVTIPRRRARRLQPARAGGTFDIRRTLRRSLRTHGEPIHRAWRRRATRLRPLVLLLDVSGSMSAYSRALLQFGYAAMGAGQRVEVFCFGTRLTRVTRALRVTDPDRALAEVGEQVRDWSGGTRIGDSVKQLVEHYGRGAMLRGAVVVICSDGLERGDPDALAAQMARLRRLAHRVVWVNPLKGDPRYRPLARGMAAAMPFVDTFLPGHNLASLEALGEALAG